ncbi:hypothetical protein BASA50_003730 [Batrachochytrium salamandrivorans]|uniref:Protein YOP1 n=1 Tax=Batrachochytrium salamandrivorans TaxID=1357716 RepID=A0ABQ8FIB2_9FUNG|nr:hypothetical protein BASA62_009643 [Batrachochytrium salamandrivorans]KAH6572919.1 hypothetical protein BASA60_006331 [Batrachochytrium salamandrivorans]KAH6598696.1 hypothetical protein BASA50_003730 [Batrachochytrium salamandrivorans]KAH9246723.1 hypothetical protein BASA81_015728 [Batrachochytrium salamandrivorans]KAH9267855.1 hypothetical protein BASA83_009678 [Batrachochytrium salamandrivorans]
MSASSPPSMAKAFPEKFNYYHDQLNKELSQIPVLVQFEKQTHVPKTYLVAGVGSVVFLLIFVNIWGNLLTNLMGFLYPAYASFKAIESRQTDDDVQWLTYWCVFGFFNILEFFADILLYWLPLYYTMKALVILWLVLPQFKGSVVLYKGFIRPFLIAESKTIDSTGERLKEKVTSALGEVQKEMKSD